jgi:hypothetical protein
VPHRMYVLESQVYRKNGDGARIVRTAIWQGG